MIQIVEATNADLPTIQSIAHRTWPSTFGNILSEEQIDYMLDWMYSIPSLTEQVEKKNHVFLLAKEDDESVGFTSYELKTHSFKTKIHKIYILPSSQGKGIGKKLLEKVGEIALKNGDEMLSLNVNRYNPAVDVYKRMGFSIEKEENIYIGNGFFMNDYVMEKKLRTN